MGDIIMGCYTTGGPPKVVFYQEISKPNEASRLISWAVGPASRNRIVTSTSSTSSKILVNSEQKKMEIVEKE